MKRTTVTIHVETLNKLLHSLQTLSGVIGRELTWDEYLDQIILLSELYRNTPVQAKGIKKYTWAAECPNCHQINSPLDSRRAIVWRVKCLCGREFIATS